MGLTASISDGANTAIGAATTSTGIFSFVFSAAELNKLAVGGPSHIVADAFAGNDNNQGFQGVTIGTLTVTAASQGNGGSSPAPASFQLIADASSLSDSEPAPTRQKATIGRCKE